MAISLEEGGTDTVEPTTDGPGRHGGSAGATDGQADVTLDIPADAAGEEAAAIVAAVREHLRAEERRTNAEEDERSDGRWVAAGRMRRIGLGRGRMPTDASSDPWAAAGRAIR